MYSLCKYVIALVLATYATGAASQFSYSVYNGNFDSLPDFSVLTPIETGTTDFIDLSPANHTAQFALLFTTQLTVSVSANYDFRTTSDDGSRILIDDRVVVDNNAINRVRDRSRQSIS